MMDLMGRILAESGAILKGICYDAHGSHSMIRRIFFGQLDNVDDDDLGKLGFWKDLEFKDLPVNILPKLPIKVCLHRGSPFYGIPGVCDLS